MVTCALCCKFSSLPCNKNALSVFRDFRDEQFMTMSAFVSTALASCMSLASTEICTFKIIPLPAYSRFIKIFKKRWKKVQKSKNFKWYLFVKIKVQSEDWSESYIALHSFHFMSIIYSLPYNVYFGENLTAKCVFSDSNQRLGEISIILQWSVQWKVFHFWSLCCQAGNQKVYAITPCQVNRL